MARFENKPLTIEQYQEMVAEPTRPKWFRDMWKKVCDEIEQEEKHEL